MKWERKWGRGKHLPLSPSPHLLASVSLITYLSQTPSALSHLFPPWGHLLYTYHLSGNWARALLSLEKMGVEISEEVCLTAISGKVFYCRMQMKKWTKLQHSWRGNVSPLCNFPFLRSNSEHFAITFVWLCQLKDDMGEVIWTQMQYIKETKTLCSVCICIEKSAASQLMHHTHWPGLS